MKDTFLYWRAMLPAALTWDRERAIATAICLIPMAVVALVISSVVLWAGVAWPVLLFIGITVVLAFNMYVNSFVYSWPGIELYRRLSDEKIERKVHLLGPHS